MGEKLSPRELELYRRCDEVLHYVWDPIGVAGAPAARDEYHAYLPTVFAHVRDARDPDALVAYLLDLQEKSMGLRPDRERARSTVQVLREWREWIWEHVA